MQYGAVHYGAVKINIYLEHTDGAPVDDVDDEHSELNCDRVARFKVLLSRALCKELHTLSLSNFPSNISEALLD